MGNEEIRLRILEMALKFKGLLNSSETIKVCKEIESYVFNLDKASNAPSDGEKRSPRSRA